MPKKQPVDWNRFYADEHPAAVAVDSRGRLRICLAGFVLLLLVVAARAVYLEVSQGTAFRAEAARPLESRRDLPGVRGRIIAADGSVLAHDQKVLAVALKYRYLEEPPNPRWLRSTVRARLARAERKDERRVAEEEALVLRERRQLAERLADLCEITREDWRRQARQVQARVERISQSVNQRRLAEFHRSREEKASRGFSPLDVLQADDDGLQPRRITVREELDSHVMAENVSMAVAIEIKSNSHRYPGVTIVEHRRRVYPRGSMAAHVLGYLGKPRPQEIEADAARPGGRLYHGDDRRGRAGLELRYETLMHGRRGELVETTDQGGRMLYAYRELEPGVGRDLVLNIRPRLQAAAERLLDDALQRRAVAGAKPQNAGGAIVVMDARTGGLLASASAPRFDPNDFSGGCSVRVDIMLNDPSRPMFDRVANMAIAPGSVFKAVTAAALLEEGVAEAGEPFDCQGYLKSPQRLRCAIYRHRGVGHGPVTLADALAQSCNVYFFHHVAGLDPNRLADWAGRFGFGNKTGVDLPDESAGRVPRPETIEAIEGRGKWHLGDTRMLAVGQGSLTTTPLQIARLTAALANGGRLVTPHLVTPHPAKRSAMPGPDNGEAEDLMRIARPGIIDSLSPATLESIRLGFRQAVADEKGTAHATLAGTDATVACKTGTAETGGGRWDHAWVAGYAPSDNPRYVFVVVIQHAGNAAEAACPAAKRLITRMEQLGLL